LSMIRSKSKGEEGGPSAPEKTFWVRASKTRRERQKPISISGQWRGRDRRCSREKIGGYSGSLDKGKHNRYGRMGEK